MTFFQIMTLFHVSHKPLLLVFQSGFISKMSHIIIRAYLQKEPLDCLVLCPHQIASAKFWGEKVIRILAAPCWNSTKLAKSALSLVFLMYCFETYSPCMNGWNIGVFKVCWNIGNFQHLENSFTKLEILNLIAENAN